MNIILNHKILLLCEVKAMYLDSISKFWKCIPDNFWYFNQENVLFLA